MKFRTFRKRVLRTLNGLLAGVLLCGSFTACGKENTPAGTDATSENATSPATDSGKTPSGYPSFADLSYAETIGKPKIRAAFAGSGKAEGIPFLLASPSGDVSASVSARWNSEGVTLSFIGGKAETVAITMGNYKNTLTLAQGSGSVTVSIAEAKLSLVDVGQELPLKMELRNGSASLLFDGCVVLNDYDVYFSSDSSRFTEQFGKAKLSVMGKTEAVSNADSGVKASGGAITLFDRYTSVGKNYGHLRNTVTSKPISGLGYAQKNLLLEFDLNLKNMPVQSWSYLEADYAYGFSVALCGEGRGTIIVGFVNTADGIYAYVNGKTSDATIFLPTGKQVGETFHAGLVWIGDKIEIFIDNVSIGYVTDAANSDSGIYAENTLTLVWQRGADAPAGSDDNFIAEINRMTLANLTPYTLLGTVSADSLLGTEARVVDGDGIFLADRDLKLPNVLENRKYGLHADVAWYSDNPTVIGVDGKLTKPESTGEIVTLKAVLILGRTIITEAQFSFFVKAKNPVSNVLRLKYDKDPVKGSGTTADTTYIADGVYNSIIYDMKQSEPTNPDIVLFNRGGVDCAYILTTNYRFLVENFSNYLYKTKGAFDSFENGSAEAEGWIPVVDSNEELAAAQPTIVRVGATHGNYAMHVGSYSKLSRSIPSVTNGIVSMDLFVEKMGGMTFELQTAYNSAAGVSAPITLTVDANGAISYSSERGTPKTTGLFLSEGANHISITFNGKQGTATLSVNGKNATILFRRDIGDCICFAYLYTQKNTSVAMDCFTVIDMD